MKEYIKLIRVKHWIKNLLIFLPIFFSKNLGNQEKIISVIIGFISFSFVASSIYIINDIRDVEKDRKHPIKKNRPIATGKISIKNSIILSVLLLIVAFILLILGCIKYNANLIRGLFFLILYFALNFAYSMGLKNKPIIDIAILASGFVIRVLFGGAIIKVNISSWLFLTIFAVSFYLGLGKRRNEYVKHQNKETRSVLKFYNEEFLNKNMYMCLSLAICFYALWAKDYENPIILWSVPLIMLMCMKYSLNIEQDDSEGDPTDILIKDKFLIILEIIYGILMLFGIYIM